ncbi:unnamed protein product [Closterium sp. NIES-65]|nr:unnamed protein product [Closterium sp. NIES-65]
MAKNKSPDGDGLPKELFEAHWDLLGESFMALVRSFDASATLPSATKEAVTIVLHKKGEKDELNNYRPITLLNFTYKVIARVVLDWMKLVLHLVISPEQYGFIAGRRLSDAVALVADVIDAAKNGAEDWGLHEITSTKLLVNGWLGKGVEVVSGVRQGCPLALYLFLCAVDPLAREVERQELGLSKQNLHFNYLGYVDDTTLALQGAEQIVKEEEVLDCFEKGSGLATNKSKSVLLPLGANLGAKGDGTSSFKWAKADEAERLLGV